MNKIIRTIALGLANKYIIMILLGFCILSLSSVSAFSTNTFSNSLIAENLTYLNTYSLDGFDSLSSNSGRWTNGINGNDYYFLSGIMRIEGTLMTSGINYTNVNFTGIINMTGFTSGSNCQVWVNNYNQLNFTTASWTNKQVNVSKGDNVTIRVDYTGSASTCAISNFSYNPSNMYPIRYLQVPQNTYLINSFINLSKIFYTELPNNLSLKNPTFGFFNQTNLSQGTPWFWMDRLNDSEVTAFLNNGTRFKRGYEYNTNYNYTKEFNLTLTENVTGILFNETIWSDSSSSYMYNIYYIWNYNTDSWELSTNKSSTDIGYLACYNTESTVNINNSAYKNNGVIKLRYVSYHFDSYTVKTSLAIGAGTCDGISIPTETNNQLEAIKYKVTYLYEGLTNNTNIKINNNQFWNIFGYFNQTNNRTTNFASYVNNYLSTCSYLSGYCNVPITFHSDTTGILQYSDMQFDNLGFIENNQTFNSNTYETKQENFSININYDSTSYTLTNAYLNYAGTSYLGTTSIVGTNAIASKSLNIPVGIINNTFYWTFGLTDSFGTTTYYNSTFNNQSVSLFNMSLCGSPYTVKYINFTFHNDTLLNQPVKATFVSSFTYWLDDPSVNKTFSYSSAVETSSYAFCFTPSSLPVNLYSDGYYTNSYSNQRNFVNTSILTNSSTTKDLLLLPTSSGAYISFIIQNSYQQRIENALISISKSSNGAFVESRYTDGTGIATFSLDPNVNYLVKVTASGYDTFSSSVTPSASPVTYTLATSSSGTGGGGSSPSYTNIIIKPSGSQLENNTIYTFSFNISSTQTFSSYGFSLWNSTTQLVVKSGSSSHGSYLYTNLYVGNQSYIIMRYYYIVGGVTTNGTASWYVSNSAGSDTSIASLLTDLNSFVGVNSTGLFGIKRGTANGDFTFAIIIFIITFFIAGIMTYKYGITGVTGTMFLIFSVVLFFDVGENLIPNLPNSPVPHVITIIVGIVTIGTFIREMT